MLGADFAGLDEFGGGGGAKKAQPRMRKLTSKDGAPIMDQLRDILSANFLRVLDLFRDWDINGDGRISCAALSASTHARFLSRAPKEIQALTPARDAAITMRSRCVRECRRAGARSLCAACG